MPHSASPAWGASHASAAQASPATMTAAAPKPSSLPKKYPARGRASESNSSMPLSSNSRAMLLATCKHNTNTTARRRLAARNPVCTRTDSAIASCCTNRLASTRPASAVSTSQSNRVRSASRSVNRAMAKTLLMAGDPGRTELP